MTLDDLQREFDAFAQEVSGSKFTHDVEPWERQPLPGTWTPRLLRIRLADIIVRAEHRGLSAGDARLARERAELAVAQVEARLDGKLLVGRRW